MSGPPDGFPRLPPRRRRSNGTALVLIVAAFVTTMALYHFSYDDYLGKGSIDDGLGMALGFLMIALMVERLPLLWMISRSRWFENLILPALIVLVVPYLYFTFLAYYLQPVATVLAIFSHLFVLTYLSWRV